MVAQWTKMPKEVKRYISRGEVEVPFKLEPVTDRVPFKTKLGYFLLGFLCGAIVSFL